MSMTDPLIGNKLGDYQIEGLLGTGGMARVYQGYDDNLDRYAAVKVIEPQLIASAEEEEYRERFLREARAIARLNHPRIVSVYQFNQVGNLYYIAMEYVEGENLRDILRGYIKQGRVMPTDELLKVLRDIADALDYAHKQDIIHRDIKPSNIIVTGEGNAVLTDFGLALNAVEGTIGNTFGSVHYIAPEQAISSAQAVPQSDQYSLGIVAYELLTGRVPFDDASAMSVALKHISDPPPPPTELNPNIPAEVEQALMKVLDKEFNRRYPSSLEFVRALELAFEMHDKADVEAPRTLTEAVDGPPPTSPLPPPDMSAPQPPTDTQSMAAAPQNNRSGMLLGTVIVLLVVVVAGAALFINNVVSSTNATATAEVLSQQQTADVLTARQTQDAATSSAQSTQVAVAATDRAQEATDSAATDDAISAENTADAAASLTADAINAENTADAAASLTADAISVENTADAATSLTAETNRETHTPTTSPTRTGSPTLTATATTTATASPTLTPTLTASPTLTPSNTPRPTRTPLPGLAITDESDTRRLLLRYDGRMMIMGNRDSEQSIDISDLVFVLYEPNEDGVIEEGTRFFLTRTQLADPAESVTAIRCLQILDSRQFSTQPSEIPLADDLCGARPFWMTMVEPFWISPSSEAYFKVLLGPVDELATCQTQRAQSFSERRCAIDINP